MPKIGITGYAGHVGQELLKFPDTTPLICDVRMKTEVDRVIKNTRPDIIVHLASISDVDICESKENFELVKNTNVVGAKNVYDVADKYNAKVVLMSSAHVFDGRWGNYKETSKPNPINMYGLTKLGAEGFSNLYDNIKVVRTSYLFNHKRLAGDIYCLRMHEPTDYPTFIERSFMYLPHFVEVLYAYLLRLDEMPHILHIAGSRGVSWYDFMKDLETVLRIPAMIKPRHKEWETKSAPRPRKATLNVGLSNKLELPQYGYLEGLRAMRELL